MAMASRPIQVMAGPDDSKPQGTSLDGFEEEDAPDDGGVFPQMFMHGPYGKLSLELSQYSAVVLVAGGIG